MDDSQMTRFAREQRGTFGAFPAETCASRTRWFADLQILFAHQSVIP